MSFGRGDGLRLPGAGSGCPGPHGLIHPAPIVLFVEFAEQLGFDILGAS